MFPIFVGMATHTTTALTNAVILAALTVLNVAIALGLQSYRADAPAFWYAIATAGLLAFFEYLGVYRGLKPSMNKESER